MRDEKLYLVHIIEASARLQRHLRGGKQAFVTDETVQDAAIKVLSNLTESASRLEETTINTTADIPWKLIAGFRNVLVHNYLGDLELEKVWKVIEGDLPQLVKAAKRILKDKYNTEL